MKKYYMPDAPAKTAFPISKSGYPFIFAFAFVSVVFALLSATFTSMFFLFLTFFVCFFFRDPDRLTPRGDDVIVSPADGRILKISIVKNDSYLDGEWTKISIFMSIFNVHVNRVPLSGIVEQVLYYPGKYFSASLDKSSEKNERNVIIFKAKAGVKIYFVQIAGLVARRIICEVQPGDELKKGQRFGLICFGSRVDLYVPLTANIGVKKGDRVKAGSSILGEIVKW